MDEKIVPMLYCPTCYSTDFKTSRPRPGDWVRALFSKQPVRCQKCGLRLYASREYVKWLRKHQHQNQDQDQTTSVHA